jgi:hypothetical protein
MSKEGSFLRDVSGKGEAEIPAGKVTFLRLEDSAAHA